MQPGEAEPAGAATTGIRYTDGAAYELSIGQWSQLAADGFLWLAPAPDLSWLDVGCGNGAFTERLVRRCAPRAVTGLDPADAQLSYGRSRLAGCGVRFRQGDAMSLPFPHGAFDAAVMALVIFFLPEPARGVVEMARVVGRGGMVAAYAWDMTNGGFPYAAMQTAMAEVGVPPLLPPSAPTSRIDAMRALWIEAGLQLVEPIQYVVHRTYESFEDLWSASCVAASVAPKLRDMAPAPSRHSSRACGRGRRQTRVAASGAALA